MTMITELPIRTRVFDPAEFPAFMSGAGGASAFAARGTLSSQGGNLTIPLDAKAYTLQITETIQTITLSGIDSPELYEYGCSLTLIPHASEVHAFIVPETWRPYGALTYIDMPGGSPPVKLVISTEADGSIAWYGAEVHAGA